MEDLQRFLAPLSLAPQVTARRLQAKDRASRRMSESRGSVIDSYLDVGIPSGDVFRRELDSDEFARDMMDYLLVNLQSDDQERASQIPLLAFSLALRHERWAVQHPGLLSK
eukprot:scaffold19766_cov122-Isochrysis_galbana.AAC.5